MSCSMHSSREPAFSARAHRVECGSRACRAAVRSYWRWVGVITRRAVGRKGGSASLHLGSAPALRAARSASGARPGASCASRRGRRTGRAPRAPMQAPLLAPPAAAAQKSAAAPLADGPPSGQPARPDPALRSVSGGVAGPLVMTAAAAALAAPWVSRAAAGAVRGREGSQPEVLWH